VTKRISLPEGWRALLPSHGPTLTAANQQTPILSCTRYYAEGWFCLTVSKTPSRNHLLPPLPTAGLFAFANMIQLAPWPIGKGGEPNRHTSLTEAFSHFTRLTSCRAPPSRLGFDGYWIGPVNSLQSEAGHPAKLVCGDGRVNLGIEQKLGLGSRC
jgi:hypothetical protein